MIRRELVAKPYPKFGAMQTGFAAGNLRLLEWLASAQ
jgi:hypothetical protein